MKILILTAISLILIGFVFTTMQQNNTLTNQPNNTDPQPATLKNTDVQKPTADTKESEAMPPTTESHVLNLSNQGLTTVPAYVFEKTETYTLDLSHNKLTGALQAEIRHLAVLRTLDLSDNSFTGVPAEVGQLSNLETLDLSNNKLTGLPHELGNLKNLNVLDLRGNNYAKADLEIIKKSLPATTQILVD